MDRQTQAIDAAGTTTFAYNVFSSLSNETVIGVAGTNTIERGRDAGYTLNGVRQSTLLHTLATSYCGRFQSIHAIISPTIFAC